MDHVCGVFGVAAVRNGQHCGAELCLPVPGALSHGVCAHILHQLLLAWLPTQAKCKARSEHFCHFCCSGHYA